MVADDGERSVYSFLRWGVDGTSAVACVANWTPVPRESDRIGLPWSGTWEVVLDTDGVSYGGSGYRGEARTVEAVAEGWQGQPCSATVTLPPLGAVWIAGRRPSP